MLYVDKTNKFIKFLKNKILLFKVKEKMENKKHLVIEKLFKYCKKKNSFVFDNELVKEFSKQVGFGNPFDVTKLDSKDKLPKILLDNDYCIIHLGEGKHKFYKGIDIIYHNFEKIEKKNIKDWKYIKSLLNQFNSSESNILSVANNQRILHQFLFGEDKEFNNIDISKRPKTYFPHRTKTTLEYSFGSEEKLKLENIQLEIDLTIEFDGVVGVFEGKNGTPNSFSVYQIYHPFLYYYNANKSKTINGKIRNVISVYVVRETVNNQDVISLWAYTFNNPTDITSISLIKSAKYKLIQE